jgi:HAD superfamily hydrolase (TIGR01484 family)
MAARTPNLLLSFDFDGTLVDHGGDPPFHPALAELLREFRKRGAAWLVNTGRGLNQTLEGLAQHSIFLLPDYIIAQECEIFRPGFFKPWRDFGSWNRRARREHDRFVDKHRKFLSDIRRHVSQTNAEFLMGDFGQVGVVAKDDAELDKICQYIDVNAAQHPDVGYHRNGRYLRFSHAAFSKGSALRELSRLLRLPPDRVFAAGDNHNDLSMLDTRIAAQIACPSNALDPVKEHVSSQGGFVCSKPASEGMIEALEHFFLRRR